MFKRSLPLCFSLLVLAWATALPCTWAASGGFYSQSKEGFYWYQDPPEEPKEGRKESSQDRALPSLQNYTYDQLWTMHPDEFKELITEIHKKAAQYPTEENMKEYMVLESIAAQKARAFANVKAVLGMKYPQLSTQKDAPSSNPGRRAKSLVQSAEIQNKILSAKEDYALLYFSSSSCPYCVEQDGILAFFTNKYAWAIKKINIEARPDLAHFFNIVTTPTVLLIKKGEEEALPVSVGVSSLAQLEKSIFRGIRLLNKEITSEEFSNYQYQQGGGFDPRSIQGLPKTKSGESQ